MAISKAYIEDLKTQLRNTVTGYNEVDNWRGAQYTQELLQQVATHELRMTTHNVDHDNFPPEEPANESGSG